MIIRDSSKTNLFAVLCILAAVFAAYHNALSNGLVHDDINLVVKNQLITSWSHLPDIFTSAYWEPLGITGGLYRPVTILSYMLEYSIAGHNPLLYHLDNILLHYLCTVLVFLIVSRVTGKFAGGLIGSLLFAVHPVHAEAVAWVSGRSDLLASFFTLAALYTFIRTSRHRLWPFLSPLLLLVGLMSKETALVLPVLVLCYLLLFERDARGSNLRGVVSSLFPFALVLCIYMAVRFAVLGAEFSPQDTGQVLGDTKGFWRALVMIRVFLEYLRLSAFPTDMQVHYMLRPPESIISAAGLLFILIAGALTALSPWLARNRPVYYFFILWFPITLLPVSNIIPIGILMSDRAMYMPSVSICAVGGLLVYAAGGPLREYGPRAVTAYIGLLLVLSVFGMLTYERNKVWHDDYTFNTALASSYSRVIEAFPESGSYYSHLAFVYGSLGRQDDALSVLREGVKADPGSQGLRLSLAKMYRDSGRYDLALAEVEQAISIDRDMPTPVSDSFVAEVLYRSGRVEQSQYYLDRVLTADLGRDHEYMGAIAADLHSMGMTADAERYIARAVEINPLEPAHHLKYGYILSSMGKYPEAIAEFEKAVSLSRDPAEAFFGIGMVYGQMQDFRSATGYMVKAVETRPGNAVWRYYLAAAYLGADRPDMAIAELERVLELDPANREARALLMEISSNMPSR